MKQEITTQDRKELKQALNIITNAKGSTYKSANQNGRKQVGISAKGKYSANVKIREEYTGDNGFQMLKNISNDYIENIHKLGYDIEVVTGGLVVTKKSPLHSALEKLLP